MQSIIYGAGRPAAEGRASPWRRCQALKGALVILRTPQNFSGSYKDEKKKTVRARYWFVDWLGNSLQAVRVETVISHNGVNKILCMWLIFNIWGTILATWENKTGAGVLHPKYLVSTSSMFIKNNSIIFLIFFLKQKLFFISKFKIFHDLDILQHSSVWIL